MLYQAFESQRTLMEPFIDFAHAAAKLYSNPMSPAAQNPFAQRVAAAYSLIYRLGKDYEKPSFDIQTVDVNGVSIAVHERIEIDKPFCELRRFKRFSDDPATLTQLKDQPAVLIVAPLSGHYATLLRDTVKTALKDHKVYITDWKNARDVPLSDGEFHLDDYVNYVQEFIRHLQGKYGNCHVISVCQPTVPVFAAISLMASRGETTPLSMVMMGGPIDARLCATAVNDLATTKPYEWFENNVIYRVPGNFPGAGRRVYPGFLQYAGFVAMNPDRHASSHFDYFKDLLKGDDASAEAHRKFYDEYNAVLDMDADYYLETIKTVFQDFSLVKGTWDVKSVTGELERVRPGDITTTAVLTVEGELDDISGAGQTRAALEMCSGVPAAKKEHYEAMGAGHYGIFSGRRWREHVYPAMKAFILANHQPAGLVSTAPAASKTVAKAKSATRPLAAPARATSSGSAKAPAKTNGAAGVVKVAQIASKPAAAPAAKPVAAKAPAKAPAKAKTTAKAPSKPAVPVPAKKASQAASAEKVAPSAVKASAPAASLAKPSKASKAAKTAPSPAASVPAAAAKAVAVAPKAQPAKVNAVSKPAVVTPTATMAQPPATAVQAASVATSTATPSSAAATQSPAA